MPELPVIESLVRSRLVIPDTTIAASHCGQPRTIKPSVQQFECLGRDEARAFSWRAGSFLFHLSGGDTWFHTGTAVASSFQTSQDETKQQLNSFPFISW